MREARLTMPENARHDDPEVIRYNKLRAVLEKMKSQHAKVYKTFVQGKDQRTYVFVTTSKDIHLKLGILNQEDLLRLGDFLREEFTEGSCDELLLFPESKGDQGATLVTLHTLGDGGWHYHLSPAH